MIAWGVSLSLGIAFGLLLGKAAASTRRVAVGIALSTTAVGTLVPILADAGLLRTPLGSAFLGMGVAGEFGPIVVISIFTGVYGALTETLLLIGFGGVVLLAAAAARARPPRVVRALQQTVHTTGQAAVRLSIFILLLGLPRDRGRLRLRAWRVRRRTRSRTRPQLAGKLVPPLAAGSEVRLAIPIYFVVTGMTFDLDSLLTPTGLGLAALFLSLFVVVRGTLAALAPRTGDADGPSASRCAARPASLSSRSWASGPSEAPHRGRTSVPR